MHNLGKKNEFIFNQFVTTIENGFVSIRVKKPFEFAHMICIKNGWAIDSIGSQVYEWKGQCLGYKGQYDWISAIDCDKETPFQKEKDYSCCIDLTED